MRLKKDAKWQERSCFKRRCEMKYIKSSFYDRPGKHIARK